MHPAAWIVWATCAGIVALSTTNPVYLGLVCAVGWLVYTVHRTQGPAARAFRFFVYAALFATLVRAALVVFTGVIIDGGRIAFDPSLIGVPQVVAAFFEGFRLGTLLLVFGTFNAVTDPYGILRLAPRRFHEPALATALALSIAPRTIAAATRVREAQRLRGIRIRGLKSLPALAVPVLETGLEEAVVLAESMDARGHGCGTRSRYRPQRWQAAGLLTAGCALVSAAAIIIARTVLEAPSLAPVTNPLGLPPVSAGIVLGIILLAAPAAFPPERAR